MRFQWILISLLTLGVSLAHGQQSSASTNQLALSQGIASPAVPTVNLFSNGFTMANPVALSYQSGYRGTLAIDGSDSTSFGADVGVGDGQYGLALSAYSNGCDGCEAFVRGGLSAIWDPFAFGVAVLTAGVVVLVVRSGALAVGVDALVVFFAIVI